MDRERPSLQLRLDEMVRCEHFGAVQTYCPFHDIVVDGVDFTASAFAFEGRRLSHSMGFLYFVLLLFACPDSQMCVCVCRLLC